NHVFNYLQGDVYIQAWPGKTSTETRLMGTSDKVVSYGHHLDYEGKMFAYNVILRSLCFAENPNADLSIGFDHCNDCSLENNIWSEYITKFKILNTSVTSYVKQVTA